MATIIIKVLLFYWIAFYLFYCLFCCFLLGNNEQSLNLNLFYKWKNVTFAESVPFTLISHAKNISPSLPWRSGLSLSISLSVVRGTKVERGTWSARSESLSHVQHSVYLGVDRLGLFGWTSLKYLQQLLSIKSRQQGHIGMTLVQQCIEMKPLYHGKSIQQEFYTLWISVALTVPL